MTAPKPTRSATRTPGVTKLTYASGMVRFECRVTHTDRQTGKREPLRPAEGPFEKYEPAREWVLETRKKLSDGVFVATRKRSGMTITEAVHSFIAMLDQMVADGHRGEDTVDKDWDNLQYLIRAFPPDTRIARLTVKDYRDVQDRGVAGEFGKPWSMGTYNQVIGIHHLLGDHLVSTKEISVNVARTIPRRKQAESQKYVPETWTVDEMRYALERAPEFRHGSAFVLALSGFRRGEISGLRESDVDFSGGNIVIANTRRRNRRKRRVLNKPTKSRKTRDYPLNPELEKALRRQISQKKKDRLAFGEGYVDSGFMFTRPDGAPYSPDAPYRAWVKFYQRIGLKPITLHGGRHTFATLMAAMSDEVAPKQELSRLLGHSRTSYTMDTYVHSQPERLKATSAAYGRLMSGA